MFNRFWTLPMAAGSLLWLMGCAGDVTPPDIDNVPDSPDPTDQLFDPDHVIEVEVEIDPADWDVLRYQSRSLLDIVGEECQEGPLESPYTWFTASVTLDGESFEEVGIRKKGLLGSDNPAKPSIKLNMDLFVDGGEYLGKDMLTFNNARQDPSYMDQCIGYALFAAADVPACRCNFAHVTVNGVEMGPYVQVESVRRDFLARHFEDNSGNHYEGTLSDLREDWINTFEPKKNADDEDRSDLQAVVDALAVPDDQLVEELGAVVDLEEFYSFWAAEVITGHWDGYANATNNFHIYHDPTTDRFFFIPWGIDALFDYDHPFGEWRPNSVTAGAALSRRLYLHPDTQPAYLERLEALLDDVWDSGTVLDETDRMEALLRPYLVPQEEELFEAYLDNLRTNIDIREDRIRDELADGPPIWTENLGDEPCLVDVGSVEATFETIWGSIFEAQPTGTATMTVEYNGEELEFSEFFPLVGGDEVETDGYAVVAIAGEMSPSTYIYPQMFFEPGLVQSGAELTIDWKEISGYLVYAQGDQGDLMAYLGDGTLLLDVASTVEGEPVTGSFTARLFGSATE